MHDLGGMDGFGAVPIEADEPLFHERWEGRVWRMLAAVMGSTTIDRFRYTIEQMPPAQYLASSYYERWLWAIEHLAAEQGILDSADQPVAVSRPSPTMPTWDGRFHRGDRVRVRNPVTTATRGCRVTCACTSAGSSASPSPGPTRASRRRPEPTANPSWCTPSTFAASDLFGTAADHTVTADLGESDLEQA